MTVYHHSAHCAQCWRRSSGPRHPAPHEHRSVTSRQTKAGIEDRVDRAFPPRLPVRMQTFWSLTVVALLPAMVAISPPAAEERALRVLLDRIAPAFLPRRFTCLAAVLRGRRGATATGTCLLWSRMTRVGTVDRRRRLRGDLRQRHRHRRHSKAPLALRSVEGSGRQLELRRLTSGAACLRSLTWRDAGSKPPGGTC
jgi:hypothetical protein